jgi:hypothetical protein
MALAHFICPQIEIGSAITSAEATLFRLRPFVKRRRNSNLKFEIGHSPLVSQHSLGLRDATNLGLSANKKLSPNLNSEVGAEANLRIARISGVGRFRPSGIGSWERQG